ncbi:hypothetical protein [Actinomyces trachealis]|uniref:variant leucine-rich repeat-containing protein n=1 Tax=Actinomyces trachealis TaxID=2763540 RepID=UPI001892AA8B|nr:hypothetical protein [Actinomyces trachealis]
MSLPNPLAAVEARDPATSTQRLYEIASADPGLHLDILFNPACSSELRNWIAQSNPEAWKTWQAAHLGASGSSADEADSGPAVGPVPAPEHGLASAPTAAVASVSYSATTADLAAPTAPGPFVASAPGLAAGTPNMTDLAMQGASPTAPTADAASMGGWEAITDQLYAGGYANGFGAASPFGAMPQAAPPKKTAWKIPAAVLAALLLVGGGAVGAKLLVHEDKAASAASTAVSSATPMEPAIGGASVGATEAAASAGPSEGSSAALPQEAASALAPTQPPAQPPAQAPAQAQAPEQGQPPAQAQAPVAPPNQWYGSTKLNPAPASAYRATLMDTETQNISCEISETSVSCSIAQRNYSSIGQPDCSGDLFSITLSSGYPSLACGQAFLGSPGQHVQRVGYGEYAASNNYACLAEVDGVSCWNQWTGHGFKIAREGYTTF